MSQIWQGRAIFGNCTGTILNMQASNIQYFCCFSILTHHPETALVKAPADQLDGHVSLLWDFRSTDAHERRR
jgi:hypothetical protein